LAKVLSQVIGLRLLPIVIACFIMVNCIGLVNTPTTLANMIGVFIFMSLTSVMLFLWIGFGVPRAGVANFVCVVVSMFALALSGFLLIDFGLVTSPSFGSSSTVTSTTIQGLTSAPTSASSASAPVSPVRWVPYVLGFLDYLRPAFEILLTNELSSLTFNIGLKDSSGQVSSDTIPLTGEVILAQLGLSSDRLNMDFGLLAMWFVVFFFASLVTLELSVMERR